MARSWSLAFSVVMAWAAPARADVARLVLVVGNNRPAQADQTPLRYADDDAIRYFERFEGMAADRILVTRLDRESHDYASIYPTIPPPTRAELRRAAQQLRAHAAALRAQGRFVELVFIFAGHGGMQNGRPYLALEDGRLGRDELEQLILEGDPADVVHVVIDACQAAGFVESRGPLRAEREPLGTDVLPFGSLVERHPRAGFVVAASASGAAFEWSRFGSGVASHLLRSALSGAADMAPPDGRVTYDEIDAFLRTATRGILPSEYRQEIRVIAPRALPSAALVDLARTPRTTELLLDRPGRYYVRDADGRRIVDLRHGRGTLRLLLPAYSPRFALVEVQENGEGCAAIGRRRGDECTREERQHELQGGGQVVASALTPSESTVATRGIVEDSVFEELFVSAFDSESIELRTRASARTEPEREPPPTTTFGLGYRGVIGETVSNLGPMSGMELRIDIPIGRFSVTSIVSAGRATASGPGGSEYPVFQIDAGVEAAYILTRRHATVGVGVELRSQGVDQAFSERDGEERFGWFVAGGTVASAWRRVARWLELGFVLGGGARVGTVDDELRLRPYAALHAGARAGM